MTETLVWLDCDPGHDDAFAIILAGHTPGLKLIGISSVFGNQSIDKTTHNALKICHISGIYVPVFAGSSEPLFSERRAFCPEIHGDTGLDGAHFPDTEHLKPQSENGILGMRNGILGAQSKVTLVCTGALTNAALLLKTFPEVKQQLQAIVLMGGAVGVGNTGPVSEFNIQIDPEAAKIVFDCGLPVTMVPLEVTHTVLATEEHILSKLRHLDSPFSKILLDLLLFFSQSYKEMFDFDSPPLHDPAAVGFLIRPELYTIKKMRVDVETASIYSAGQTICDQFGLAGPQQSKPKNVDVALKLDVDKFWEMMFSAIEKANIASPLNVK